MILVLFLVIILNVDAFIKNNEYMYRHNNQINMYDYEFENYNKDINYLNKLNLIYSFLIIFILAYFWFNVFLPTLI